MPQLLKSLGVCIALACSDSAPAQGTFLYDQQSVTNDSAGGEGVPTIQSNQPIGQSFTPALGSIGFIRLFLIDGSLNGLGANVYLNLRSDSITGPILSSTDPVFMPDGFGGPKNFLFPTPVAVTPGVVYFFQPVVQSGDLWGVVDDNHYNYPGGTAIGQGIADPVFDLWFREGIIVPEPSGVSLFLLAMGLFAWRRWKSRNTGRSPCHSRSRISLAR